MGWSTNVVESRQQAMELLDEGLSAGQVAGIYGVSRQTVQKWKSRYRAEGVEGLTDRSHAAHSHPYAVSREMERRIVRLRRRYREGPRKLRMYLLEELPGQRVPAASTIGRVLKRHKLTEVRTRRRRSPQPAPSPLTQPEAANDVWCVDFKGEFEVGRRLCYPITVTDGHSRFALVAKAESGTGGKAVDAALWRAFRRHGLPRVIRSDNGPPFASFNAPRGLSRVSVVWLRLGIRVERTEPGKPYQNGAHERFHKTLKHHTAKPPASTFPAQQKRFDRFRRHYNLRRPHESLDMRPPAELYAPSSRPCPDRIPAIEHPDAQRILKVSRDGRIHFRSAELHLSKALIGETVGIVEVHDDIYEVSYGPLSLALLNYRHPEPTVITYR